MILVDAKVPQLRVFGGGRQSGHGQLDVNHRARYVIVVIMPRESAELIPVEARQRGDIGLVADAALQDSIQRHGTVTVHRQPLAGHLREHPEHVEHRLVDAIARQRAEAGEVGLVLELEGPG